MDNYGDRCHLLSRFHIPTNSFTSPRTTRVTRRARLSLPLSTTSSPPRVHPFVCGPSAADGRRPSDRRSSYRSAEVAAIRFGRAGCFWVRRSLGNCAAFALKGPNMPAQGKATRVVRASPPPWEANPGYGKSPERAKQPAPLLVSPFQGLGGRCLPYPGRRCALPWADLFWPLRGGRTSFRDPNAIPGRSYPAPSGRANRIVFPLIGNWSLRRPDSADERQC